MDFLNIESKGLAFRHSNSYKSALALFGCLFLYQVGETNQWLPFDLFDLGDLQDLVDFSHNTLMLIISGVGVFFGAQAIKQKEGFQIIILAVVGNVIFCLQACFYMVWTILYWLEALDWLVNSFKVFQ